MKAIIIFCLFTAHVSLVGMQKLPIAATSTVKDLRGKNLLHYVAMLPDKNISKADLKKLDKEKARIVALLFNRTNARVDEKDKEGKTPYDLAEIKQKQLPKVFKVMKACKTVQDIYKQIESDPDLKLSEQKIVELTDAELLIKNYDHKCVS